MARAHRLGQTNKVDIIPQYCYDKLLLWSFACFKVEFALVLQVMIYRLVTRGTIEERMMQMTKKKMVLEHLVVGRLKAQNINQVNDVLLDTNAVVIFCKRYAIVSNIYFFLIGFEIFQVFQSLYLW